MMTFTQISKTKMPKTCYHKQAQQEDRQYLEEEEKKDSRK